MAPLQRRVLTAVRRRAQGRMKRTLAAWGIYADDGDPRQQDAGRLRGGRLHYVRIVMVQDVVFEFGGKEKVKTMNVTSSRAA